MSESDNSNAVERGDREFRSLFKWHIGFMALVAVGFVIGVIVAFVI